MYVKRLAECFPSEELPPLHECVNENCFYYEALFKVSELKHWSEEWDSHLGDLIMVAHCPSCDHELLEYKEVEY